MSNQIDPRDYILNVASAKNWEFELGNNLRNEIIKEYGENYLFRIIVILKELEQQGVLIKRLSGRNYDITSLGMKIQENGGFENFEKESENNHYNPELIESILNTNKRFSESLQSNRKTQNISLSVAIGTFLVLLIQTLISLGTNRISGIITIPEIKEVSIQLKSISTDLRLQTECLDTLTAQFRNTTINSDTIEYRGVP